MTEYTSSPEAIQEYLTARNRTRNWVTQFKQGSDNFYPPSIAPSSRTRSDWDGYEPSDCESSDSIPPAMMLHYSKSRQILIEPEGYKRKTSGSGSGSGSSSSRKSKERHGGGDGNGPVSPVESSSTRASSSPPTSYGNHPDILPSHKPESIVVRPPATSAKPPAASVRAPSQAKLPTSASRPTSSRHSRSSSYTSMPAYPPIPVAPSKQSLPRGPLIFANQNPRTSTTLSYITVQDSNPRTSIAQTEQSRAPLPIRSPTQHSTTVRDSYAPSQAQRSISHPSPTRSSTVTSTAPRSTRSHSERVRSSAPSEAHTIQTARDLGHVEAPVPHSNSRRAPSIASEARPHATQNHIQDQVMLYNPQQHQQQQHAAAAPVIPVLPNSKSYRMSSVTSQQLHSYAPSSASHVIPTSHPPPPSTHGSRAIMMNPSVVSRVYPPSAKDFHDHDPTTSVSHSSHAPLILYSQSHPPSKHTSLASSSHHRGPSIVYAPSRHSQTNYTPPSIVRGRPGTNSTRSNSKNSLARSSDKRESVNSRPPSSENQRGRTNSIARQRSISRSQSRGVLSKSRSRSRHTARRSQSRGSNVSRSSASTYYVIANKGQKVQVITSDDRPPSVASRIHSPNYSSQMHAKKPFIRRFFAFTPSPFLHGKKLRRNSTDGGNVVALRHSSHA